MLEAADLAAQLGAREALVAPGARRRSSVSRSSRSGITRIRV